MDHHISSAVSLCALRGKHVDTCPHGRSTCQQIQRPKSHPAHGWPISVSSSGTIEQLDLIGMDGPNLHLDMLKRASNRTVLFAPHWHKRTVKIRGREIFMVDFKNPSRYLWSEKKKLGRRKTQPSKGHRRHHTVATADTEKVKFFSFCSKLNSTPLHIHIKAKRPMGELKNASRAWPSCRSCNVKTSPMTPFSFPIPFNFLTIVFFISL